MKKLLLILLTLVSLSTFAQTTNSVTTLNVATSKMVWSNIDNKYIFVDVDKRHYARFVWTFTFNDNHTGNINSVHVQRGETVKYGFIIYTWEIRQNDNGEDFIWIDAMQVSDSQKVTIMVNRNYHGENMISVFMPESETHLCFDNFDE